MRFALAVLCFVGCQSNSPAPVASSASGSAAAPASGGPQGSGATSGSARAVDPWSAASTAAGPETPETRKARAEAALARVATILPKLEQIRSLSFRRGIPREYQSASDFRRFVQSEIAKELPPDKAEAVSTSLFHLGLLPKPGNLAHLLEQAFTTQAGAYYDPHQGKFFLVMVPDADLLLDTMSAHELTHALQDQHFDLRALLPDPTPKPVLNDDELAARRFIGEGDATFTMFLFAAGAMMNTTRIDPKLVSILNAQLEEFAAKSPQEMLTANASSFSTMDPEIKKSIDAMNDIPATVLVPMVSSYTYGAKLVAAAFAKGGWPAVNALYARPPESTEQALHPVEKLLTRRDRPQRVTLVKPLTAELADLVFGELQWRIYFDLWAPRRNSPLGAPSARTAASEGWGGDRASVTKRSDGRLVARIATAWDSPSDAQEFAAAYVASLRNRFPVATGDPQRAGLTRPGDSGKIFVRIVRDRVFIVDGGDDAKELESLVRTTKFN